MPGIITHNKILKETIAFLQKKKKKSYLLRSIQALFSGKDRLTAAMFGAIGPNIFDYYFFRKQGRYGSSASFYLHDGHSKRCIESMISLVTSQDDKNTEWSSIQRAYLYGFISHIISDAVIHPFIFYFSGFPDSGEKKSIQYYREQNLLYQYEIDSYILRHREDSNTFRFSLDEMLPVERKYGIRCLSLPVKSIILESLYRDFPDIYKSITWIDTDDDAKANRYWEKHIGHLDFIPGFIKWTYRIKFSGNTKFREIVASLRKKGLFSDFIVQYPIHKTVDLHIINHYKERWHYPAGPSSIHYESFEGLLLIAYEKIVEAWEAIEKTIFSNDRVEISELLSLNAYTGVIDLNYNQMKQKSPLRIKP